MYYASLTWDLAIFKEFIHISKTQIVWPKFNAMTFGCGSRYKAIYTIIFFRTCSQPFVYISVVSSSEFRYQWQLHIPNAWHVFVKLIQTFLLRQMISILIETRSVHALDHGILKSYGNWITLHFGFPLIHCQRSDVLRSVWLYSLIYSLQCSM